MTGPGNHTETDLDRTDNEAPGEPALRLDSVWKTYRGGVVALRDITLTVGHGEFLSLLGPSGSGKTTMLMVIAGFALPSQGALYSGGREFTNVPPQARDFGVVFQSYALFPHMTVERNIAYPLGARKIAAAQQDQMVHEVMELVGLQGLGGRRPGELSGGQQQRVAIARALVYRPRVLLLDEPLGALDRALRERMQEELRRIHRSLGVTVVYVTHDQSEALFLSDRVAVLNRGVVEQVATPTDLYDRPANEFVAGFVGDANFLPGRIVSRTGDVAEIILKDGTRTVSRIDPSYAAGTDIKVVVRPEQMTVVVGDSPAAAKSSLSGSIRSEAFTGAAWRYTVATEEGELSCTSERRVEVDPGASVMVQWDPRATWAISNNGDPMRGGTVSNARAEIGTTEDVKEEVGP